MGSSSNWCLRRKSIRLSAWDRLSVCFGVGFGFGRIGNGFGGEVLRSDGSGLDEGGVIVAAFKLSSGVNERGTKKTRARARG